MTLSGKAQAKLLKARRLMIIGLIASVFGNYVVNAGFSAFAASGTIAVSALVALKTIEQIIVSPSRFTRASLAKSARTRH